MAMRSEGPSPEVGLLGKSGCRPIRRARIGMMTPGLEGSSPLISRTSRIMGGHAQLSGNLSANFAGSAEPPKAGPYVARSEAAELLFLPSLITVLIRGPANSSP